tara:strand:+ start:66 stop:221 length:156 start_codon:yes stop_codon:yes gene_type:complete
MKNYLKINRKFIYKLIVINLAKKLLDYSSTKNVIHSNNAMMPWCFIDLNII